MSFYDALLLDVIEINDEAVLDFDLDMSVWINTDGNIECHYHLSCTCGAYFKEVLI